jgi:hypothetical protein
MGILDKLFGKKKGEEVQAADVKAAPAGADVQSQDEAIESAECPHTALGQRWENPEDMGKEDLATYVCTACGERFGSEEGKALMERPPAPVEKAAE